MSIQISLRESHARAGAAQSLITTAHPLSVLRALRGWQRALLAVLAVLIVAVIAVAIA